MGSEIYDILHDSSADLPGQSADNLMMLARSMIVPKNSGIQNILPHIIKSINRARMLRPPYRQYALQKAKEALYGIAAISSENGALLREMNTTRSAQSMSVNQGPAVTDWDRMFYGNEHLKNNPKAKKDGLFDGF